MTDQQPTNFCPGCAAPVRATYIFCPSCNRRLADVCTACSGVMPQGAKFCPACGRAAKALSLDCAKCGARIYPLKSGFCPECGQMIGIRCAGCGGGPLQEDWTVCPMCGRRLGGGQALASRPPGFLGSQQGEEAAIEAPAPPTPDASQGATAERFNQTGAEHYEAERYEEAIKNFRMAVQLDPSNTLYRCNLAVALGESEIEGGEEEAFGEFQKVLQSNPNDITALLNLGYMFSERERYDEAKDAWQRVTQLSPDSPEGQEAKENLTHLGQL